MKKFWGFLANTQRKFEKNIKKKKMKLLTKEQQKSYENVKICYISKRKSENKYLKHKKHSKVRDHCHYTGLYR